MYVTVLFLLGGLLNIWYNLSSDPFTVAVSNTPLRQVEITDNIFLMYQNIQNEKVVQLNALYIPPHTPVYIYTHTYIYIYTNNFRKKDHLTRDWQLHGLIANLGVAMLMRQIKVSCTRDSKESYEPIIISITFTVWLSKVCVPSKLRGTNKQVQCR